MKKALIVTVVLVIKAYGQLLLPQDCGLRVVNVNVFGKVDPPGIYAYRDVLAKSSTANIEVSYVNFPSNAQSAFDYAKNICSYLINSPQTIKIRAEWKSLGTSGILAAATPESYKGISGKLYPVCLAEMINNTQYNGTNSDILIEVNSDVSDWYFGTDGNVPSDKTDFPSVVLHELAHGLGFTHSFDVSSANGNGSWGNIENNFGVATVYDGAATSGNNFNSIFKKLTNTTSYPNPSRNLGDELVSNNIYFDGSNSYYINNNSLPKLYAPFTWSRGSSIAHLDNSTYPWGNSNFLMTSSTGKAQAIHSPGEIGMSILQDIGWSINRVITFTSIPPGTVWQQGATNEIKWTDNKSGSIIMELLKKDGFGNFVFYSTITSTISNQGSNSHNWSIPTDVPTGDYRIKIRDTQNGYGLSNAFAINTLPQVATPIFNPPGNIYTVAQNVSISTATSGADIRYTENGTDPTESSTLYSGPILFSTNKTLKAKAFKSGYNPSVTASATYTFETGIKVSQVSEFGGPFGSIGFWHVNGFWSYRPSPVLATSNVSNYTVLAQQSFLSGTYQKFWRWELNSSPSTYQNFATIAFAPNTSNDITAPFKTAVNATIQAQLIEGGNPGGYLLFKDPWLADYDPIGYGNVLQNQTMSAPFKQVNSFNDNIGVGSVNMGVFKDQSVQGGTYYSVQAPQTQPNINGFAGVFMNWEATNANLGSSTDLTTSVVFNQSNALVTAKYKAHRGSSLPNATASNGQQKLWSDYTGGTFDLIYSSLGEIWWTRYNSSLTVLVPEKRLSDGSGNYDYPSLVKTGSKIYAVWQRYYSPSNQYLIYFAKYDGSTWSTATNIGWADYSTSYNPAPVVSVIPPQCPAVIYDHVEVVWNQSPTVLASNTSYNSGTSWAGQATFPGSGTIRPSLSSPVNYNGVYGNTTSIALATDDNSSIYIRRVDVPACGGGGLEKIGRNFLGKLAAPRDWTAPETVPGSYSVYGSTKKAHATHSTVNSRVYVTWQAYTGSHTVNFISKYLPNGSWSALYTIYLTYSSDFSPVVSALSNGDGVIAFNDYNGSVPMTSVVQWLFSTGQMFWKPGQLSVQHPQVSTSESSPTAVRFVTTGLTGAPYQIGNSIPAVPGVRPSDPITLKADGEESNTGAFLEVFGRKITAYDTVTHDYTELELTFPMVKTSAGNVPFSFVSINDTMPRWDRTNPWAMLSSQEINVPADAETLDVAISFLARRNSEMSRRVFLKLIDSNTKTEVATLGDFESKAQQTENRMRLKTNLQIVRGRKVRIEAQGMMSAADTNLVYSVNHLLRVPSSNVGGAARNSEVVSIEPVITQMALQQNYPNPFNPETNIEYQLKEPGHVRLIVYDMLGREVAELVNSAEKAGFHMVTWKGKSIVSGTYFYNLIVVPQNGKSFTETRKMIFAK